jgi:hypothetical protein
LLAGGVVQLTAWKTRQLERCRMGLLCRRAPSGAGWSACRDGLRYGVHCCLCCAGFTLALLGSGMMDLAAVGGIAALITLERVARRPDRAARAAGILLLVAAALRIPPVGELHPDLPALSPHHEHAPRANVSSLVARYECQVTTTQALVLRSPAPPWLRRPR